MDHFPASLLTPVLPLVVLSGLAPSSSGGKSPVVSEQQSENGPGIPLVFGAQSHELLRIFEQYEGDTAVAADHNPTVKLPNFHFKRSGRHYSLPSRASDLRSPVDAPATPSTASFKVHSSLSPLSPESPLYPDGLMSSLWTTKYQDVVPSLVISFFRLTFDSATDSIQDNRLKNEIATIKFSLNETYSRIRFAVVIVSEKSIADVPEIDERLNNIRKATKLDARTSMFFYGPAKSDEEQEAFGTHLMTTIRPLCLEFYRDMVKYRRRKRDKRNFPVQTAIHDGRLPLSKPGWIARDEFKLAFLSEYTSDFDASSRHYRTAWELLFERGIMIEYAENGPRWDEICQFADVVAARRLRCLLGNGLPSAAARFWRIHKTRMMQHLEPRHTSSWQSKWMQIMAEIIQEIPDVAVDLNARKAIESIATEKRNVFAPVEKSFPAEDVLHPWNLLHHVGYWLSSIAGSFSPVKDSARTTANAVEDYQVSNDALEEAIVEFVGRRQVIMADVLKLKLAKRLYALTEYTAAKKILLPLWRANFWRRSGWWAPLREVTLVLHKCAKETTDYNVIVTTLWELMSAPFDTMPGFTYNFELPSTIASETRTVHMKQEDVHSFLAVSFCFLEAEVHAGQPCVAQLAVHSLAPSHVSQITLSRLYIEMKGEFSSIDIEHDDSNQLEDALYHFTHIALEKDASDSSKLTGKTNLSCIPRNSLILTCSLPIREAGELLAIRGLATLHSNNLTVEYSADLQRTNVGQAWWIKKNGVAAQQSLLPPPKTAKVLPKLPKVSVRWVPFRKLFYADEEAEISVHIVNDEEQAINATIEISIKGADTGAMPELLWSSTDVSDSRGSDEDDGLFHKMGTVGTSVCFESSFRMRLPGLPTHYSVETKVSYTLLDDPETTLFKIYTVEVDVERPFEAHYTLEATLHPDPWPNFFTMNDLPPMSGMESPTEQDQAHSKDAIISRWMLKSSVFSFVKEDISISSLTLLTTRQSRGATFTTNRTAPLIEPLGLKPKEHKEHSITIELSNDISTTALTPMMEADLVVKWRVAGEVAGAWFSTSLPVPRLSFPVGEPRAFASCSTIDEQGKMKFLLTLENPSVHYLSFNAIVDSGEEYAFSGPKQTSTHLVPLSRQTISYTIVPFIDEAWIQPLVKIVDVYFNQTLHLIPTGSMKKDEKGVYAWVDRFE